MRFAFLSLALESTRVRPAHKSSFASPGQGARISCFPLKSPGHSVTCGFNPRLKGWMVVGHLNKVHTHTHSPHHPRGMHEWSLCSTGRTNACAHGPPERKGDGKRQRISAFGNIKTSSLFKPNCSVAPNGPRAAGGSDGGDVESKNRCYRFLNLDYIVPLIN